MEAQRRRSADRRVSLVIPAYNEAAGIRQAVLEAGETLPRLAPDFEVLVVDDGSRDATAALVRDLAPGRPWLRLLRHFRNRGYGAALRTGFEAARFELVAFTDADCQFHLDDLALLLSHVESCPVVVGYRLKRCDRWLRKLASWGYNSLVRLLLGTRVRDCDCALKLFRKESLAQILPQTTGFLVNAEMLTRARQRGFEVAEVGVRHRPRLHGRSTVSVWDIPRTLRAILPFWWSEVLWTGRTPATLETRKILSARVPEPGSRLPSSPTSVAPEESLARANSAA